MFEAGTHVPVRDPHLRSGIGRGAARCVAIGVLAALVAAVIDAGVRHRAFRAVRSADGVVVGGGDHADRRVPQTDRAGDRRDAAADRVGRRGMHRRAAAGDRPATGGVGGARIGGGDRLRGRHVRLAAVHEGDRAAEEDAHRLRGSPLRTGVARRPRRAVRAGRPRRRDPRVDHAGGVRARGGGGGGRRTPTAWRGRCSA